MRQAIRITGILLVMALLLTGLALAGDVTQGTLQIIDKTGKITGECPLKHTDVKASISGFIARVTVVQEFQNTSRTPIEAVYVFPLPQNSAVDSMVMKIGSRTVKGVIKKKEEARKIYEDARRRGQTAALLDQERPNIFTQSVANIMPGESIKVEISYVDVLEYTDGLYEFVFPMVVGPRYMPGTPTGKQGTGWAPDTSQVPDASRISPPVAPKGTRAGHDISLTVSLDAGVPVKSVKSVLHKVRIDFQPGSRTAKATLSKEDSIPNKDFILQYRTAGGSIEEAMLTEGRDGKGYFTLILQPPAKPKAHQITPKEMFFVIDSSGSQMGWPIEKAKETMKYCIENMNPEDTFQLLSFSNNVRPCFEGPRPNSKENREAAQQWLAMQMGHGGTEMMKAIDYSLGAKPDPNRMRIVVFMTDGYVGNDMAILDTIKKKLGAARLFPFGTGNSVNRYLLEGMAKMGKGEVEWVTLNRHGDEVAEAFQDKIGNPLLLDVKVDWGKAPVKDVYPREIPDLFSGKPIIIKGRYTAPFKGEITLQGKSANQPFSRKISVNFPQSGPSTGVIGVLWARTKIDDLMSNDLAGIQGGQPNKEIKDAITKLGLEFRLMTQFTSFVAVEEKVVNQGGKMTTVAVPVEMPDGVSHEGVFGDEMMTKEAEAYNSPRKTSLRSSGAGASAPASIAAPPPSKPVAGVKVKRQGYVSPREYEPDYSSSPITPEQKMDKSLKDIAGRVKKEGRNGNLDMKNFKVKNGRVELILTVTHVSGKMLHQLRGMGFSVKTFSKTQKIITGSIAVDKVQSLSKLNFVTKIEPNPGPAAANGLNPKEVTAGLHRLTGQMFAGLLKLITV